MAQNEMALQFFGRGFFNPQLADQALACLDMMDFDRKQFVVQKIGQNGTMHQQLMTMQQQMMAMQARLDRYEGTHLTQQAMTHQGAAMPPGTPADISLTEGLGGAEGVGEHYSTKNARQRTAQATAPA
jgi:hypothetical protein